MSPRDLTAVIPAGGAGTRLWPLSRRSAPKFLHDLTGSGRTLLQQTVDRLAPLTGERLMVVTGIEHADAVRAQLPGLPEANLLLEPSPRDSMAAIGMAAAVLERRDPDTLLGSFAADHVIGDDAAFAGCVRQAVVAARGGALVTLGITPTSPATAFGYIRAGEPWPLEGAPDVHRVEAFVEKPDAERAREYVAHGHLWNAGMFVARASVLLGLLDEQHPEMVGLLRRIAARPDELEELWPSLPSVAIDVAVAEPAAAAGRVAVVPASFPWDDVGDFAALARALERSQEGRQQGRMTVLGEESRVVNVGSTGIVAAQGGRTVVTLGVDDLVVVDSPDALLVTTRDQCQDVGRVVATLRDSGREDLT